MATLTRRLLIQGRVQGVGFRWSLMKEAQRLGLDGWVRNRSDGSVEAEAHGPEDAVDALTIWAYQGPPHARVDNVRCQDTPGEERADSEGNHEKTERGGLFVQRPTL